MNEKYDIRRLKYFRTYCQKNNLSYLSKNLANMTTRGNNFPNFHHSAARHFVPNGLQKGTEKDAIR